MKVHNFGTKFKMSTDIRKRTGLNTERESGKQGKRRQERKIDKAEEEERLVEKKTPNVILHSLHGLEGWGERERKTREREGGMGEGRERGAGEEKGRRRRVTREKV